MRLALTFINPAQQGFQWEALYWTSINKRIARASVACLCFQVLYHVYLFWFSQSYVLVHPDGLANRGQSGKEPIFHLVHQVHEQGVTVSAYGIGADFGM